MKNVPLGQVCEINPNKPSRMNPEFQCSFIPMEAIDDQFGVITKRASKLIKAIDKGYTPFQEKDVLFAKITPCMENGKCAIANNLLNGIGFGSTEFHVIRAKKDVIPAWVYYYLRQPSTRKIAARCMTGSAGQKRVPSSFLEDVLIPLPSLPEQQRIATILGKVDRLRRLRRYALELSGTYLQSVFLEMFGDPMINPKGWDLKTLGDVIYSAQDGPHISPDYSETGVPFLSTRNIRPGQVIWEDLKFISHDEAEKHWEKCKPQWGDILYTKGGTTGLAKVVDFDREIAVWVHIAVLKPNNQLVDSLWLESMLNSTFCYNQSQELTHGIANHDLGLTRMVKIKLYLPPLPLQREFMKIAKKYIRFLAQQHEAERQAEHLFQTLLHKAFRGELGLDENKIAIPDVEVVNQEMPIFADVIEPINTDAYQLALPLE